MDTHRLNIDFPAEEYTYLKMLCAQKGISLREFIVPLIVKGIEDEEDAMLAQKAVIRMKNMDFKDLISIEEAFQQAGWHD